jgi:DNA-binding transcriptional regulator/RsmH inhibitor MraZ
MASESANERRADDRGRISLPKSKFASKKLEVVVLGEIDEDG